MDVFEIAQHNQDKAWNIIKETNIIDIWRNTGAEINLVGSLKTGLLMKHKDIDFHIYSSPLSVSESFKAISKLAENPSIKRIEYSNLIDTDEKCIEWHAWYLDKENELWQFDMIHILKGSFYDGYFEKVADKISSELTPELKKTILTLKFETPDNEKIMGIEYCKAVIKDGIKTYSEFEKWRKAQTVCEILEYK